MCGYYPQQVGRDKVLDLNGGGGGKRPAWAPLMSVYFQKAGYRTYHSGKWHIDGDVLANGFDRSYHLRDQHRFFNPTLHFEDDKKLAPVKREDGFYGTVAVADKMLNYLESHHKAHQDKPFFAYLAFAAPHFPLHALPEDIVKVGERYKSGWDVIRQKRWEKVKSLGLATGDLSKVERDVGPPYSFKGTAEKLGDGEVFKPLPWNELNEKQKKFQQDKMTVHAAMIERMDVEIGRITSQLKRMSAYENTVIIFLSDNGASAEIMVRGDGHKQGSLAGSADSHLCLGPGWSTVSNTPFRMHKTWVHEGGSCTPFIVHWPQGIQKHGEFREQTGHVIDIMPTFLKLAEVEERVKSPVELPGRSLVPTFDESKEWNRNIWFAHDGHHAIRSGNWKLARIKGGQWELYNLKEDRAETNNVAVKYPEKVKELEKLWLAKVEDFKKHAPKIKSKRKKR